MVQSLSSPFITHHQPSLIWLTSRVARSSVASGNACRSSVVTSLLTKKLVVPTASLPPTSCSPFFPVSVYFTLSVRANSVVANTLPRTERAGARARQNTVASEAFKAPVRRMRRERPRCLHRETYPNLYLCPAEAAVVQAQS